MICAKHFKQKNNIFCSNILIFVIFLIISIFCHIKFLGEDGYIFTLIGADSTSQMLPFTAFLEQNWAEGNFFWSYNHGLGGDIFSEYAYYYSTSPFFILRFIVKSILDVSLFDYEVTLLWKVVLSIFKQYIAMIAMYELLKYENNHINKWYNAIGSVAYGTGIWFIYYSLRFDYMTDAFVWLPLICLGIQKVKKENKTFLFVFSFSSMLINSFYFGYMSCIFVGSYLLLYIYDKNITLRTYLKNILLYVFKILISFGIAAVFFLPAVHGFLSADREAANSTLDVMPNISDFLNFFENVFMVADTVDSSILTSLPICFIIIFFIFNNRVEFKVKKKTLLALFWLIASFIPVFSSIMNGFSYETNRWYYIILFVCSYALPSWLNELEGKLKLYRIIILVVILFIYFVFKFIFIEGKTLSNYEYIAFFIGIISLFVLVVISRASNRSNKRLYNNCLSLLFIIIALAAILHNIAYSNIQHLPLNKNVNMNEVISHTLSADISEIKKDDFYRISDRNIENSEVRSENTYLLADENGLSLYNSLINKNLQKHLKENHNVYMRYMTPSYYNGFDERLFLENVWGVKYIMGREDNDEIYGYKKIESNNDVIYENRYCLGIDLWYDSVILSSNYKKLSVASRDAAVMQAAVVEDSVSEYPQEILDETVTEIPLDFFKANMENCNFDNEKIYVKRNGDENINKGIIRIPLPKVENEGEFIFSLNITVDEHTVDLPFPTLFKLNVNGKDVYKYRNDYKWSYDLDCFTFKLDKDEKELKIELTPGVYKIISAGLYFSSYEKLEEWTAERNKYNIEDLVLRKNIITGHINNNESGILTLNIPYNDGWKCYIDGEETKIMKIDEAFMGIALNKGKHYIRLVFLPPLLIIGFVISITCLLLEIVMFFYKKYKSMTSNKKNVSSS